jgi:hypothetical protein
VINISNDTCRFPQSALVFCTIQYRIKMKIIVLERSVLPLTQTFHLFRILDSEGVSFWSVAEPESGEDTILVREQRLQLSSCNAKNIIISMNPLLRSCIYKSYSPNEYPQPLRFLFREFTPSRTRLFSLLAGKSFTSHKCTEIISISDRHFIHQPLYIVHSRTPPTLQFDQVPLQHGYKPRILYKINKWVYVWVYHSNHFHS